MHPLQNPTPGKQHSQTISQSRPKSPEGHHEAPSKEGSGKFHQPVRRDSEEHAELKPEGHHDRPNKQHDKPTLEPAHRVEQVPPEKEHPKPQGHNQEDEPDKDHQGGSNSEDIRPHDSSADTHPLKPEKDSLATILRNRPFDLRIITENGGDSDEKFIPFQILDSGHSSGSRVDATSLTLAALRKQIHHMYPSFEEYCTPSRKMIHDEFISIAKYLEMDGPKEKISNSVTPTLNVYIRLTKGSEVVNHLADGSHSSSDSVKEPEDEQDPKEQDPEEEPPRDEDLGGQGDQAPEEEEPKDQDNSPEAAPTPTQDTKDDTTSSHDAETLKPAAALQNQIYDSNNEVTVTSSKPGAGDLSERQWATVLRNCALFYGWIIDHRTNRVTRAPKPAFQLRSKTLQKSNSTQGIPNFQINDDSQIEITAHEDNLTRALTQNDFSGQSTDGSVSAGAYGVSVGVSAGHGSNNDTTTGNQTGTKNKTLFARYLLPRCDIVLWPDELEPTPELARLIEAIHRTKNIKILQRLHAEYGNYFSQRVTLGGRLLSSKVLAANDSQDLDQQKQSFRTSVGTSVSGNVGIYNASVSASHEFTNGNAHTNQNSSQTQNEACVFEAVGGDTILATNPKEWCPTVADYTLWRVINRGDLSPLSQMLSGIPGFEAVPSWFVRAVPALSRYITLDQDHGCKARFRVMSPTDSSNGNVSYYLGHDPNKLVTPQSNTLDSTSIFQPDTYQAPAVLRYEDFKDGKANFATEYNAPFVIAEWDIIAPFDRELKNGTRVILRSCFQNSGADKDPKPIHMVVFRSVQGEFVPAMSDSSDYQYWRILKTDAGERHIKPGDNIRLCWDFQDQTTGWRDFTQDVFGRRETKRPSDVQNPLFIQTSRLVVPSYLLPQLLGLPSTNYLIDGPLLMSAERGDNATRLVKVHINNNDTDVQCHLQHLRLRIDSVGNGGRGDAEDYLLKKVEVVDPGKTQKPPVADTNNSSSLPAIPQQGFHMWLHQAALLFGL